MFNLFRTTQTPSFSPTSGKMILAVVGWRKMEDYDLFSQVLSRFIGGKVIEKIISRGCPGADTLAERFAHNAGIPFEKCEYQKLRESNDEDRSSSDVQIAQDADYAIVFRSQHCNGSTGVDYFCRKMLKPHMPISITEPYAPQIGFDEPAFKRQRVACVAG